MVVTMRSSWRRRWPSQGGEEREQVVPYYPLPIYHSPTPHKVLPPHLASQSPQLFLALCFSCAPELGALDSGVHPLSRQNCVCVST